MYLVFLSISYDLKLFPIKCLICSSNQLSTDQTIRVFVSWIEWKWLKCFPGCNVDWLTQQWTVASGGQGRRDKFWYFHSSDSTGWSVMARFVRCLYHFLLSRHPIDCSQTVDSWYWDHQYSDEPRRHIQHWSKYIQAQMCLDPRKRFRYNQILEYFLASVPVDV